MKKFIPFCLVLLCLVSCKKEMFDAAAYNDLINETAPIGDIDPAHTWNLTSSYTVDLQTVSGSNATYVQVLTGNPNQQENVEILAEQAAGSVTHHLLFFYAPSWQQTFYAAAVAADGTYRVKTFQRTDATVVLDDALQSQTSGFKPPVYQTYTYLYEEEYPKPSEDWDFNDCVLRFEKQRAQAANEVRLKVTLAAVGATKQIAAAVRLLGYHYDDIESVEIAEGRTFDNISVEFKEKRVLIESTELLLRGQHGEAVLNLFEDAHWVMSPRLRPEGMGVVRMFYNTNRNLDGANSSTSAQMRPKERTFIIRFRKTDLLQNFTLESLDPFIIEDFNSGKWEVHTHDFKADAILHDYGDNETARANNMVWALKIPYGAFRWPQEGIGLGFYKADEETGQKLLTGAYMEWNHSFGQWVNDHTVSLDWYRYPTTGLVY